MRRRVKLAHVYAVATGRILLKKFNQVLGSAVMAHHWMNVGLFESICIVLILSLHCLLRLVLIGLEFLFLLFLLLLMLLLLWLLIMLFIVHESYIFINKFNWSYQSVGDQL